MYKQDIKNYMQAMTTLQEAYWMLEAVDSATINEDIQYKAHDFADLHHIKMLLKNFIKNEDQAHNQ